MYIFIFIYLLSKFVIVVICVYPICSDSHGMTVVPHQENATKAALERGYSAVNIARRVSSLAQEFSSCLCWVNYIVT